MLTLDEAQDIANMLTYLHRAGCLRDWDAEMRHCQVQHPKFVWAKHFDFSVEPHIERILAMEREPNYAR